MAITVKKIQLWRKELTNKSGTLASALEPLANANQDLTVVMGYVFPGNSSKAALEVYPVSGAKAEAAAKKAGLKPASDIPCLMIEGDSKAGVGHAMTSALAKAKINLGFFVVQVIGKRFTGVLGFDKVQDMNRAVEILKSSTSATKKPVLLKAVGPSKVAAQKKSTTGKKAAPKKAAAKKAAPKKAAVARKPAAKKPMQKKTAAKPAATKPVAKKAGKRR